MEQIWVVVEADGTVSNTVVADDLFVAQLREHIADDAVDTGTYHSGQQFVDVTALDPRPGVGWTKKGKKFIPPPVIEPPPEVV